ncbi:Uncharacterised protein family (UPF0104) [Serratia quinivorans]|uniref:hypothetical protein n=1 Tax=Serratia quinivorans TaxID=137545 RepID=UPI002179C4A6|nr:hypothetical protein [Serratia quinivorans]CAI1813117.1 Uncharacterised protein family (UPF0104) [Serratia quinivorans]
MMLSFSKRTMNLAGSALALIGIIFVVLRLHRDWKSFDLSYINIKDWLFIASLVVLYSLASVLLALAWRHILKKLNVDVTRAWSVKIYGISQLAKYVPGNIFHIAGRQALGMFSGVSGKALAKSSLWELGLISVAGGIFGWLVLPLLFPGMPIFISIILTLLTIAGVVLFLHRYFGFNISIAFILQFVFLIISGVLFVCILNITMQKGESNPQVWMFMGSAYVVAWLVGLVTPGAPAGVGVREVVLFSLLKIWVLDADLLVAVILGRMVTVVGDLLFFSTSFLMTIKKSARGSYE